MEPLPSVTVEQYFLQQVHRPYAEAVMGGLIACYRNANLMVESNFPGRIGAEARAHIQRAFVDTMLEFEAKKHPQHVRAVLAENSAGNSVHTEVYCGRMVLTAHYIPTPKCSVRDARYRAALADHPGQYNLFGEPRVSPGTRLYGQIVHGCTATDR